MRQAAGLTQADLARRLQISPSYLNQIEHNQRALTAGESGPDTRVRDAARTLGRELRSTSLRGSLDGVRHILDAVLAEPYGADVPGARHTAGDRPGTVIGLEWAPSGPPTGYLVRLDGEAGTRLVTAG